MGEVLKMRLVSGIFGKCRALNTPSMNIRPLTPPRYNSCICAYNHVTDCEYEYRIIPGGAIYKTIHFTMSM